MEQRKKKYFHQHHKKSQLQPRISDAFGPKEDSCICLFVTFYPHHQFNRAERHRREAGRWEHPKTVF